MFSGLKFIKNTSFIIDYKHLERERGRLTRRESSHIVTVGYLSSEYSYIFKTCELHKGRDDYKIILNCPSLFFHHRPTSLYLQNMRKPSFLAKIMRTIISIKPPSLNNYFSVFIFFFSIYFHISVSTIPKLHDLTHA